MNAGRNAKVQRIAAFVSQQFTAHKQRPSSDRPMFVGIQGPQGSGKSFLTDLLPEVLAQNPYNLRTATLSLDDLYLNHEDLTNLSAKFPDNKLLLGRGQPGTHDLALAVDALEKLSKLKNGQQDTVQLPVYDKSAYSGKGDRSARTVAVTGPVDIVIFEGWAVGFKSLSPEDLKNQYNQATADPSGYAQAHFGYEAPFMLEHSLADMQQINQLLQEYEGKLWSYLSAFVQLKPESMSYVWKWRLEQEHGMKAKNGGFGMTDDEVKAFIGRYMPGYECFLSGVTSSGNPWSGRGLQYVLDSNRDVVSESTF